jgi:hypothetical protein
VRDRLEYGGYGIDELGLSFDEREVKRVRVTVRVKEED